MKGWTDKWKHSASVGLLNTGRLLTMNLINLTESQRVSC